MTRAAADALQQRLVSFAVKIIELVGYLPEAPAGHHVSGQILRSGTSPAPNYGEARGAESRADFVHKLRIAVKELNETGIWLLILLEARMAPTALVNALIKEESELACILGASIGTARTKGLPKPTTDKSPLTNNKFFCFCSLSRLELILRLFRPRHKIPLFSSAPLRALSEGNHPLEFTLRSL